MNSKVIGHICTDCKSTRVRWMIPECDFMPHGYMSEQKNHPREPDGSVVCSDELCNPTESELGCAPSRLHYKRYESIYPRCEKCDSLNIEEVVKT
jgi:hypothetical protein